MSDAVHRKKDTGDTNNVHRKKQSETHPTRYYSHKQELGIANDFGGKTQKNSGATLFEKGDVVLEDWLIEAKTKTSDSQSMSIKKEWLVKNAEEALFIGKPYNALAFNFGPSQENYYIINKNLFQKLVEVLHNEENSD